MPRLLSDRPFLASVSGVLAALLAITLLGGCDQSPPEHAFLPWDTQVNERGQVAVFGVTLGESTLLDFKRLYDQKADLAIFTKAGEPMTLEAYFGQMHVGPLTATVVLIAEADEETLQRWAEQSQLANPTPSGARMLSMSDDAIVEAQEKPIRSISYVPTADYSEELIRRQFGEPSQRQVIADPERGEDEAPAVLWLYPEKGLAITVEPNGKELFQYINPDEFDQLLARSIANIEKHAPVAP